MMANVLVQDYERLVCECTKRSVNSSGDFRDSIIEFRMLGCRRSNLYHHGLRQSVLPHHQSLWRPSDLIPPLRIAGEEKLIG